MTSIKSAGQASYYNHGNGVSYGSDSPSNIPSLTPASTLGSSYGPSSPHRPGDAGVLEDTTVFPELEKNAVSDDLEEVQKEDPIGIDMWKFYRNKQSSVADAERMENMTWRMMAINLRKARQQKLESTNEAAAQHGKARDHIAQPSRRQATTTAHRNGSHHHHQKRKIANPRKANSREEALWAVPAVGTIMFEEDRTGYHHHQAPSSQPSLHQQPLSAYTVLDGPRGHVHMNMPENLLRNPDPALPGMYATRRISLGSDYPDYHYPFSNIKTKEATYIPPIPESDSNSGHVDDVVPWDPDWAEDAFGGKSLYDDHAPQQIVIKQEDEETEPTFDAEEFLLPENWIAQDHASQPFGGPVSTMLNQHATPHGNLSQWQQFEESHYAELSSAGGQRPPPAQFGAAAAQQSDDQYGQQVFMTSGGFGLGGSNMASQLPCGQQQAGCWSQEPHDELVGSRKRRKGGK